jgi:hypothetical protein
MPGAQVMFKALLARAMALRTRRATSTPRRCIAICIEHTHLHRAGIAQADVDALIERLRHHLATEAFAYSGQHDDEHQTRLFFMSARPDRVLPVVLARLRETPWCAEAHVMVQAGRFGRWDVHRL